MENKVLVRSDLLKVDAYRFEGLVRSFPTHFHEYYTIGYMNGGNRRLICGGREYELKKGDMVLLILATVTRAFTAAGICFSAG